MTSGLPAAHRGSIVVEPFPVKTRLRLLVLMIPVVAISGSDELLFQDDFKGQLGDGWTWVREHREGWRLTDRGLEVWIEPGNMWGPANDAKNVLVRPAPDVTKGEVEVSL